LNGQKATPVAYAYSAHELEDLQDALGLFTKWLPITSQLDQRDRFADLVARLDEVLNEALNWQEFFIWNGDAKENVPAIGFEFVQRAASYPVGDVAFATVRQSSYADLFKIKLCCIQSDSTLTLELHYNSNLFSRQSIEILAEQLQALLANVAENGSVELGAVSFLGAAERERLLAGFNNTAAAYPSSDRGSGRANSGECCGRL
jgi:hypothetical protein